VTARVSVVRAATLRDLLGDKTIAPSQAGGSAFGGGGGRAARGGGGGGRGGIAGNGGSTFEFPVPPHSFRVFAAE
jgi:hypothetical protein